MDKKALFLFFLISAVAVCVVPVFVKPGVFLGDDLVRIGGLMEQIYNRLRTGEVILPFISGEPFTLKNINYPTGTKVLALFGTQVDVLMRALWGTPERATVASIMLYYVLNAFSVFFILNAVFRIRPLTAAFFSVIAASFPHIYYSLLHVNLGAFFHQLMFIYFAARFLHRPSAAYGFLAALSYIFVFNINIQTPYFMTISAAPSFLILFIIRLRLEKDRTEYLKKFLLFTAGFGLFAAMTLYSTIFQKLDWKTKVVNHEGKVIAEEFIISVRDKSEIQVWKTPLLHFILPTSENILFRKITGRKFQSTWGYYEKAAYLGIFMTAIMAYLTFMFLKKFGPRHLAGKIKNEDFMTTMFIALLLNMLFSFFLTVAPYFKLDDLLYAINQSARVYSSAMTLVVPCWVMIFAVVFSKGREEGFIKGKVLPLALMALILLDTVPSTFGNMMVRLDSDPPEYRVLREKARGGDVVMDYFGRYGGYHEYGYLYYMRDLPVRTLDPRRVDGLWGDKLAEALKYFKVKYLLFAKENREKGQDDKKIKKFLEDHRFGILYESSRSIVAKAGR